MFVVEIAIYQCSILIDKRNRGICMSKIISVRVGANEYDIIYVKGISEAYNLQANTWSTIVTIITNKQKKKIPLTTTHGNKKFNFNMNSYLQAIHSQYHTIATESKKKTTNSFFGSSSLHYSNVNTVNA